MRLRSLTKHIREQNWFAVLLDFFIVVAGILIAFQITNWNEARQDRLTERDYLERLSTDLALTVQRNEGQVRRNSQMVHDLDITLAALDACTLSVDNEAAFASGLFFLGRYNLPEFVSGAFDELNGAGNLRLIRDLDLRKRITEVNANFERSYLIDKQLNDRVVPKVNYVRKYARFNHSADTAVSNGLIGPSVLDIDFEASCRDTEFKNSVSAVREILLAVNRLTRSIMRQSSELKVSIDQAIGVSPQTQ